MGIVERPQDKKLVGCTWAYNVKYNSIGSLDHYKGILNLWCWIWGDICSSDISI